jgi:hypothetical protein
MVENLKHGDKVIITATADQLGAMGIDMDISREGMFMEAYSDRWSKVKVTTNGVTMFWDVRDIYIEKKEEDDTEQSTAEHIDKHLVEALVTVAKDKMLYNEDEVYQLTLDAVNLGMTIRQDQLNGTNTEKSGKELHQEWFNEKKKQ